MTYRFLHMYHHPKILILYLCRRQLRLYSKSFKIFTTFAFLNRLASNNFIRIKAASSHHLVYATSLLMAKETEK